MKLTKLLPVDRTQELWYREADSQMQVVTETEGRVMGVRGQTQDRLINDLWTRGSLQLYRIVSNSDQPSMRQVKTVQLMADTRSELMALNGGR